jgi:hypothetical protein
MIRIRWQKGSGAPGFVDLIPLEWVLKENTFEGTHKVTWRGQRMTAKCSVTVSGTNVDLDYGATRAITNFNGHEGIIIGTMRIVFASPKRQRINEILWRAGWQKSFNGIATLVDGLHPQDTIDDLESESQLDRAKCSGYRYVRDAAIRDRVKRRANGCCEYCGKAGFHIIDGVYLECHHIIALANQGADKMWNVIALCPDHHREAHFGQRAEALEEEMTSIVRRKIGMT